MSYKIDMLMFHLTYGYFGRVHITDKISRCSGLEEALK